MADPRPALGEPGPHGDRRPDRGRLLLGFSWPSDLPGEAVRLPDQERQGLDGAQKREVNMTSVS